MLVPRIVGLKDGQQGHLDRPTRDTELRGEEGREGEGARQRGEASTICKNERNNKIADALFMKGPCRVPSRGHLEYCIQMSGFFSPKKSTSDQRILGHKRRGCNKYIFLKISSSLKFYFHYFYSSKI